MAENLKKQNGYVPGIRPGKSTEQYVTKILYRLTFIGAIFLGAISILPLRIHKNCYVTTFCTNWWYKLTYHRRCST